MTVSTGNVILFPLSVATGRHPIDYSKRIDFERLFPIFGTCRPGGDRKREYYFLGGYDISSGNGHNGVTLMMQ